MNRLEVISAVDQSRVGRVAIPGVTSADLSADGTTIFAGTGLNGIVAVDTTALQVKARYQQAGLSPIPPQCSIDRWKFFLSPRVNVSFVFVKRVRLKLCSLCGIRRPIRRVTLRRLLLRYFKMVWGRWAGVAITLR